jgi:hypothetical protein
MLMCLPEGEKRPFTGAVHTGDSIQIDINRVGLWTTLGGCIRQTVCPFPDKLSIQGNLDSISKIEDCDSQHD